MDSFAFETGARVRQLLGRWMRVRDEIVEVDTQSRRFSQLPLIFNGLAADAFFQSMALRGPRTLPARPTARQCAIHAPPIASGACPWPHGTLSPRRLCNSPVLRMEQ